MKLSPPAACLALLTYACAPGAEPLDLDPGWQESDDSSVRPQPSGNAGPGAPTDAAVATRDASSAGSTRDAAASAPDAWSALPSRDAAANANDADALDSTSDAGAATVDAGAHSETDDAGITPPEPKNGVVVGYYPAWATYDRNYQVAQIPGAKLTHINYAFANIQDGRCVLGDAWADVQKTFSGDTWDESSANKAGNLKQLRKLKQQNPALRTLISVGGWTWSTHFSDAAATEAARKAFASSCVEFMVEHGFDGVDIDWEYPVGGGLEANETRPEDKANYTLLLKALRAELSARQRAQGRAEAYLLTIAAPAGPSLIEHLESAAIAQVVDWINVMSYDFHGGWEKISGHNAPLRQATGDTLVGYNVESAIDAYLRAGVPASRLVMGVPFYGRSFAGVNAGTTHGLHQSTTGVGPGTWENGVLDYHDIVAKYLNAAGYARYMDDSASVPYLFDAAKGVFISYDDPESIRHKRALIVRKQLAGSMVWDLSSDTRDSALLNALIGR